MLQLRLFLKNYWEAQEDEFNFVKYESHFTEDEPCNVYIIGSRPRVVIDPKYLKVIGENKVELLYKIQSGFTFQEVIGIIDLNRKIEGEIFFEGNEPYSRFNLKDDNGYFLDKVYLNDNPDVYAKSNYALRHSLVNIFNRSFADLNVLYVGKSLKMDKKLSPIKRLKHHQKLQAILKKCTTHYIDKEIYIILCAFIHKIDIVAEGAELLKIGSGTDILNEAKKRLSILKSSKELMTQISEAALIDYFDTREFNTDYIGTFGNPKHSYYPNIMKSKIHTVALEVDTSEIGVRLFSDKVEPKFHHGIKYIPQLNFKKELFSTDTITVK